MSEANYSKRSFDAVLVKDASENVAQWEAGQFYYVYRDGVEAGIISCLPNAKDEGLSWGATMFRPNADHPSWEWDGNVDKPTLSPSIHRVGHWHGWLRAGRFESV